MKKSSIRLLSLISLLLFLFSGCAQPSSGQGVPRVSVKKDSSYAKTFQDLSLGVLYDFQLEVFQADKSRVSVWVEGYRDGKKTEPFPVTELSYGNSPNAVEKGSLVFGIIGPERTAPQLFLSSGGATMHPAGLGLDFFEKMEMSTWSYAIGNEAVELQDGKEQLLAVYRRATDELQGYDLTRPDEVERMIREDDLALLLKIKIEKNLE